MKPRTYFGIALWFPYILWGICALVALVLSQQQNISDTWNMILMPIMFYAIGVILWLVPYTVLAIGIWIWSRNKSTTALRKVALVAPVLLSVLMLIEVVLISLPAGNITELASDLPSQAAVAGGFSLVFGYICVGIAMAVFKFLQARHRITEELPTAV